MKLKISREFRVGVFGVVIIAALYFGINFIRSNHIFSPDKVLYGVFSASDGLEASAPVVSKGFRVGTVENVDLEMKTGRIIVTFCVLDDYALDKDAKIKISSASLLGGKVLEVVYGNSSEHFRNHDTIPSVEEQSLTSFISSEYQLLREKMSAYSVKIDSILDGVERMTCKENTDNLKSTLNDIRKLSSSLSDLVGSNSEHLASVIRNLDSLSASLSAAGPSMKDAVGKINVASDSLPQLIANANSAVSSLSSMLKKAQSGEGNIGKLVYQEDLYNSVTSTVQSLDSLLTDLKEHPKRYINVTVFGKKEKVEK